MAVINVTVKKHLTNAFALVTDRVKALLLREPERWICRPDTDDLRIIHLYFFCLRNGTGPYAGYSCGYLPD